MEGDWEIHWVQKDWAAKEKTEDDRGQNVEH